MYDDRPTYEMMQRERTEQGSGQCYGIGALLLSFTLGAIVMGSIWKYGAKPSDLRRAQE